MHQTHIMLKEPLVFLKMLPEVLTNKKLVYMINKDWQQLIQLGILETLIRLKFGIQDKLKEITFILLSMQEDLEDQ
jgi:hypothetical protein